MSKSILIVDDSASMRQMVSFTLSEESYEVTEAEHGQNALDAMKTSSPDLVITDINMPVMDGIELIKQMRSSPEYKFIPIIVLTTESENTKQEEGKKAGATAWLIKPFTPEKLLETVKKVAG